MKVIEVRNVQAALPAGLDYLWRSGEKRESRNGPVVVSPVPVTTVYERPRERVLFWAERDANPFFHFYESLWMLAGRNEVGTLAHYVKRMKTFSDDGKTLHGAYGHRWTQHFKKEEPDLGDREVPRSFPIDQILTVVDMLRENPDDRRAVVQIWDVLVDLGRVGNDVPCNTQIYFSRHRCGALDMTVCNRSNDVIWGAYGANAVHFSMLQEFVAGGIGCEVGAYHQMSNNYHAYFTTYEPLVNELRDRAPDPFRQQTQCPYERGDVIPYPLVRSPLREWREDLAMMLDENVVVGLRDPFFRRVAVPILKAHRAYKTGDGRERYEAALEILQQCRATDWRAACEQWLFRRLHKFEQGATKNDG